MVYWLVICVIQVKIIAEDTATLEIAKTVVQKHPSKQQSLGNDTLPIQTGIMVAKLRPCLCT